MRAGGEGGAARMVELRDTEVREPIVRPRRAGVAPGAFRLRLGVRGVFDVAEVVRQESVAREGIRPAQRSRGSSCPLEPVVPPRVGRRRQPERPTSSFLVIVRYG